MKKLKSGILLSTITVLLAFMSVLYISSCDNKAPALSPTTCENVVCQNFGFCQEGICQCPVGYSDSRCGTKWNTKFVGTWNLQEVTTGSDHFDSIGNSRNYQIKIDTGSTPTSLFINGLRGNGLYNGVSATVDSTTIIFDIQPFTPASNGNFTINGGNAALLIINPIRNTDTAFGVYYIDYLNSLSLKERDTIKFTMEK